MTLQLHLVVLGRRSVLVTPLLNDYDLTPSLHAAYDDSRAAFCLPRKVNSCFLLGWVHPAVAAQISVLSLISPLDAGWRQHCFYFRVTRDSEIALFLAGTCFLFKRWLCERPLLDDSFIMSVISKCRWILGANALFLGFFFFFLRSFAEVG